MLSKYPYKQLIEQWKDNGLIIIEKVISEKLVNRFLDDLNKFRSNCNETKDEYGFGKKICQFHIASKNALQVALNPDIQCFLSFIFSCQPVLFGSLCFEVGTEEEAHRDSIFSYTRPKNTMVSVWIALEDVNPNSGPLFYYKNSHKLPEIHAEDILKKYPEFNSVRDKLRSSESSSKVEELEFFDLMESLSCKMLMQKINSLSAKPQPVLIKKGDAIIWHSLLVHGGLPRSNLSLTRNSMVNHFISKNCSFYNKRKYFLMNQSEFSSTGEIPFTLINSKHGIYCYHEKVETY